MHFNNRIRKLFGKPLKRKPMRTEFEADGLGVVGKNMTFLDDPAFRKGWEKAVEGNRMGWNGRVPDIRWRAHIALWAARHGMRLEGDFVECGVFLGILSLTICHALDFQASDRKFYLFDTYEGLPDDGREATKKKNEIYFDCYEQAKTNFAPFPNAQLVKGILPQTLHQVPLGRIAYLSVDLNHAPAEQAVIEALWDRLSPSAVVLIDDYGFRGFEEQYQMWNEFAASRGVSIMTAPTGQGILIRP